MQPPSGWDKWRDYYEAWLGYWPLFPRHVYYWWKRFGGKAYHFNSRIDRLRCAFVFFWTYRP